MGSRKSTRSIDAVTTLARLWRNAQMAAVLSIIDSTTPPNTCPMLFASPGIMSSDVSCMLSLTALIARIAKGEWRRAKGDSGSFVVRGGGVECLDQGIAVRVRQTRLVEPVDPA